MTSRPRRVLAPLVAAAALVGAGLAAALPAGESAPQAPAPAAATPALDAPPLYDEWFTDEAIRLDLYHSGTGSEDVYSFDRAVREPLWPGVRGALVDPTGYGKYRFRVHDAASGRLLFSQGYCTLFGEWQSTAEAVKLQRRRTFEEAVRFPCPRGKVVVRIDRRRDVAGPDGRGEFAEIYAVEVDPASHLVSADRRYRKLPLIAVHQSGDPRERIDILILGDGYTADQLDKYRRDLDRFAYVLFTQEAFARNRGLINLWGLEVASRDSGTDEPRKGLYRDTALGTTFNTFDSARYLTTSHDRDLREIAANAPYDAIYILVNTSRYGGGGIFNQWAVFPADNEYDDYVFIHEFGHSFAGLGDEYFSSSTAYDELFYPRGVEPWEPNLTALLPGKPLKWGDQVAGTTPIPTPDQEPYLEAVGAFEGAGYQARGLYRPFHDCKMFHKGRTGFCPVCARSLDRIIGLYAE